MKARKCTYIFVFFLMFQSILLIGQNQQKVDSLQDLLNITSADSVKIQLYGKLSWAYINTRSKTDIARRYADSIKYIAEGAGNEYYWSRYHFYAGVIDRIENNHSAGLKHFEAYINYHKAQGDSSRVARGLFHYATIHKFMGNYEKSLAAQYRVLAIQESEQDDFSAATTMQAIGNIFFELTKYPPAVEIYHKSLDIFTTLDDKEHMANVCISLGNLYVKLHQGSEAEKYYQSALEQYKDINNTWGIALALANMGFMYDDQKEYQIALGYHLEALELRRSLSSKEYLARSLIAVGRGYASIDKYDAAENHLLEASKIVYDIKSKPLIRDVESNLASIYAARKNYYKAYLSQKMFSDVNDSILNETIVKEAGNFKEQYESAQKDSEIALLKKENELQMATSEKEKTRSNALLAGLALMIIIAALIVYNLRQRLRNQKRMLRINEEIEKSQYREQVQTLEMKALRAQMNPHFLFNCLNSINTMIISDENENASKYLSKFSKLVRQMLENSEQARVSLLDELSMLESYIQLEDLRFDNKIDYSIQVDADIDQDNIFIPSMVLQPFVENAIWHGLLHKEMKGQLTIVIKENNNTLRCSIIDNGIGREESLLLQKDGGLQKKSMGIKITTERLRLLTRQKMDEVISFTDLKDSNDTALGTQVNVMIPIS